MTSEESRRLGYPRNLWKAMWDFCGWDYCPDDVEQTVQYMFRQATLSDAEKHQLQLRFQEHQTFASIAQQYGVSINGARVRCNEAMKKLRNAAGEPAMLRYGLKGREVLKAGKAVPCPNCKQLIIEGAATYECYGPGEYGRPELRNYCSLNCAEAAQKKLLSAVENKISQLTESLKAQKAVKEQIIQAGIKKAE